MSSLGPRATAALKHLLLLSAFLAAGCATNSHTFPLTGDPMIDGPRGMTNGPARDRVLWQYRTAGAAMKRGLDDPAARYLDEALDRIEGAFSPDPEAAKARGYFEKEAAKTFLGEPYERVMAYYYRGILFWKVNDLGNARACFRSAQLQDADAAEHTYAADYTLLDYLDGLASVKLGDDGTSAFQRSQEEAKMYKPPEYAKDANILFFVEYGNGPTKYATGQYHEELRIRPGTSRINSARIQIDGKTIPAPPYDDLNFQATTRGGRVMDHILANKAVFKRTTSAIGDVGIIGGAVMAGTGSHGTQAAGLGLLAFGLLSKAFSASTTPEADTRTWEGLPIFLSFAAIPLPPGGPYTATVEFLGADGQVLPQFTKSIQFKVPETPGDIVVYVSEQSITPQTL
jgi:hypothetical protein